MVKRAAELLQSGAVLGHPLQPHEAHLPFLLQFMVDYNLHGMSPVLLGRAHFRHPAPSGSQEALQEGLLPLPENIHRMSSCKVEVDALASDILNPRTLHGGVDGNPGLAGIWEEERERRRGEGRGSQPTPLSSQPRPARPPSPELRRQQLLLERLAALRLQNVGSQSPNVPDTPGNTSLLEHSTPDLEASIEDNVLQCSSASQLQEEDEQMLQNLLCLRAYSDSTFNEDEDEELVAEEEEDLSVPLESPHSVSCSIRADASVGYDDEVVWEDSYWDQFIGRIPQLDGAEDDEELSIASPVICSGKFGRQCVGNRSRESKQLSGENVIDGTRWSEYHGLLEGLSDGEVNRQTVTNPGGNILGECVEFPYDLGVDLEGLELGPICTAPTPGAYESLATGVPGANITNYNLSEISEDYSDALINDVFLSSITDDVTQCTDQSLTDADFSSDVSFQIPQSGLVFDCEDTLAEEPALVPTVTVPTGLPIHKDVSGIFRRSEDGSFFRGAYSGSEGLADTVRSFPVKHFDPETSVTNYVMVSHGDRSVNILNAAMASTEPFPNMCRDSTYVRLVPLSEYRSRVAHCGEGEAVRTSRAEKAEFSNSVFGSKPFTGSHRVVSVDRTTETSPSMLRCSNSDKSRRNSGSNLLAQANTADFKKTTSSHKDKSKKIVKFFLKSSLLREKPITCINKESSTLYDTKGHQVKESVNRSCVYHPTMMTKSHLEKRPDHLSWDKSPPRKVNNVFEQFSKKSRTPSVKLGNSRREMEERTRCEVFKPMTQFCERFTHDGTKHQSAACHVSNAEGCFLSRKEHAYQKRVEGERFGLKQAADMQPSPTTSEEDKSVVKVESSPARSRSSSEGPRQCVCFTPGSSRKHGQECHCSPKGDYDPYEFSDEKEELLSCGSPPRWPRRCIHPPERPRRLGPSGGGKPASYLQQGSAHRVKFRMTCSSATSPNGQQHYASETTSGTAPLAECSTVTRQPLVGEHSPSLPSNPSPGAQSRHSGTPNVDSIVEHIKSEPVWEEEEVTSIPKLTLLRTGDSYINFVRLDDENVCSSISLKQEPSEEDKSIEVTAVKDESEPDAGESSCSLVQSIEDDKSSVTVSADEYCLEKRLLGHFSGDCAGLNNVIGEARAVQPKVVELETSKLAVPNACERRRSESDFVVDCFADQASDSAQVAVRDGVCVEVVDLSPASVDESIEIHDISCSSGDSQKFGGKVSCSEALGKELMHVEPDKATTDCVHVAVDALTATPLLAANPGESSSLPGVTSERGTGFLVYNNEELERCEDIEVPNQLNNHSGPSTDCQDTNCENDQGVLLSRYTTGCPDVPCGSTANSEWKKKCGSTVDMKNIQVKNVKRVAKISQLEVVNEKKQEYLVTKGNHTLKVKERSSKSKFSVANSECERVASKSSIDSVCTGRAVAGACYRPRGQPRSTKIACSAGKEESGVKDLRENMVTGETASHTTIPSVAVDSFSQMTGKHPVTHTQHRKFPKTVRTCKKKVLNTAVSLVPTCKEKPQKPKNDLYIYSSSAPQNPKHPGDILERTNCIKLKCKKPNYNKLSKSAPVSPTKCLQTNVNKKSFNGGKPLGLVRDDSPSKLLRSSRQKIKDSENSKLNTSNSFTSLFYTKKSPTKSATVPDLMKVGTCDTLHSTLIVSPFVEPGEANRDAVSADNSGVPDTLLVSDNLETALSRAQSKEKVEQSPARAPTKGRKKIVCTLRNCSHNLEGFRTLSVSLSKTLPHCKTDSNFSEDYKEFFEANSMPKIIKKVNVRSKRGCSHSLRGKNTNKRSKPCELPPVLSKENTKNLECFKDSCNKESVSRTSRKVNNLSTEIKKPNKVTKHLKSVCNIPELLDARSHSNSEMKKGKVVTQSNAVSVLNKQNDFETTRASSPQELAGSTETVRKDRKRKLTDAVSCSGLKRKLRKRCIRGSSCQSEGQNSCASKELTVSSDGFVSGEGMKTRAAVKIVFEARQSYGGHTDHTRTNVDESFSVSTHICESSEDLATEHSVSMQKPRIPESAEKLNDKINRRLVQSRKAKVPKLSCRNVSVKKTLTAPLSRTLRSGKKVVCNEELCKKIDHKGEARLFLLSDYKCTKVVGSDDNTNPPTTIKGKVRSRKNIAKGECLSKQQGPSQTCTKKLTYSEAPKRNLVYVKQLRSYTSKHGSKVDPAWQGRPRKLVTSSPSKVHRKARIPCLDGASGTSSSEEESLIDCSQPSSPEPPLKKLKEVLVGVMGRRRMRNKRNDVNKSTQRNKSSGTPRKGRLGVEIVKSPRRLLMEGNRKCKEDAEPCDSSSHVVQGKLPACLPGAGHCLAAVAAVANGGNSDNYAVKDADVLMKDEIVERVIVPPRTSSDEKPKIVQFSDRDFLYSSACDKVQGGPVEMVGATNHRSVRKKLKFSISHLQQQQFSDKKKSIKILRRSSLDMLAESSSLSSDACKSGVCKTSNASSNGSVCAISSGKLQWREQKDLESAAGVDERDEGSQHRPEDSEEDEGIISFYETTLLSPAESGGSHDSLGSLGLLPPSPQPRHQFLEPFYSDPRDVTGPVQVGNMVLQLRYRPATQRDSVSPELDTGPDRRRVLVPCSPGDDRSDEELKLSPASPAPAHSTPFSFAGERGRGENNSSISPLHNSQASVLRKQLLRTQLRQALADSPRPASCCQVAGTTPDNTHAFLLSFNNLQDARPSAQHTFLTLLSVELHVSTRGDLRPDPQLDPIQAVFYEVYRDIPGQPPLRQGVIVVGSSLQGTGVSCEVERVSDELALLTAVEQLVSTWDPDIIAGYEVEMLSWGYLFQRSFVLGVNLCPRVSRIPGSVKDSHVASSQEDKGRGETRVAGRILLDVWRIMRHQVTLQSYTFESVAYHVLHQRRPLHSHRSLTAWWNHPTPLYRWIVVEHYSERVRGTVRLLEQLDVLATTSELARLFGIQFHEVLTRGSQFRVESMMLRLARLHNYVAVSPSVKQRAGMRAPEYLQLIMEPESRFYSDPVIVLDFQSLYPSIIIAYNYCYSTCLGRVELLGQPGPFKFGCSELSVPADLVERLLPDISISPCGVAFVGSSTRLGILPRMLQEILQTRLMVKRVMKEHPEDKVLQRVLHARQLGLKLIANVTYGYTAANFSGRMPCVEVGDSVVSKGRETLERAIKLVENTARWDARVVYGDTDSLFVLVAGRSRAQAFAIGAEIAQAVTLDNPAPVKLKLEKVYQPCILQTKKRYVGYAYESPSQEQPTYDAKGIETVRRDGCPVVAKMLEKSLRVLFDTRDVSLVKRYVCRQWDKLVQGRANIHDLVFAREYRGRAGYRPGACVPALQLARRWLETDPRAEPRVGERVPYVIVSGPPAVPLIRLVRSPRDLLADPGLRVNTPYYITRVIMPALKRCLSLLGANVDAWYAGMPRRAAPSLPLAGPRPTKCSTISQYFATVNCAVCDQPTHGGLCPACLELPHKVAAVLGDKVRSWERAYSNITQVCRSCCGRLEPIDCVSVDCPVLFRRSQARRDLLQETFARDLLARHLPSCDW
ncbi:uncharacterized protein LOC134542336 isoform X2 [Bacillus rossius redtenbacheri]